MGVVGVLMSFAYTSEDGLVVWGAGALMTVACVLEVTRMGPIMGPGMRAGLWLGLLASLVPGTLHYFAAPGMGTADLFGQAFLTPGGALFTFLLGALVMLAGSFVLGAGRARPDLCLLLSLWLLAPLTSLVVIWSQFGADGLLALALLSKLGDIFGYYVGNAIGKTHPFPNVSPGKTSAGCVASLLAGTAAGGLCVQFGLLPDAGFGLAGGLAAGAVINLASQAGDLLESRLKRLARVKDSGSWFGPSGGMLDLADSLLLSVPAALLIFPILFS